jgi:hypothetical protein
MLNYLHTCPTCLTFQQQVLELVVIIFVHLLHKGGQKAHTLAEVVVIDECGRCIETRPLHRNPAVAAVFCSPNSLYIYSTMEWKCHSVKQKRIDRVSASRSMGNPEAYHNFGGSRGRIIGGRILHAA